MSSSEAEALGAQAAGNGNGMLLDGAEEDPAAAFLAQQENEIAGIESDEGYGILESGDVPPALQAADGFAAGHCPKCSQIRGLQEGLIHEIADMAEALTTSPDSENVWEIAIWDVGYPVVSTLQNHGGLDMCLS